MGSEHARVRANAIEGLLPLNVVDKKALLEACLQDADARVAANAVLGLWAQGDPQVLEILIRNLQSDESRLRASTAFAIHALAAGQKFRMIFRRSRDQKGEWSYLDAAQSILTLLARQTNGAELSERLQAVRALGLLGDDSHLPTLTALLSRETDRDLLMEIERAVDQIKDRVIPASTDED